MPGVLVVGVGGGGSGESAARTAGRVAEMMGARLIIVFGYEASPMGPRGGALEHEIAAVGAEATGVVRNELTRAHPGLDIAVELVPDRPVESLVRVAEEHNADVIVVGHGGRGLLAAALLGSVTYELVHRAPVPVLVVPDEHQR